MTKIQNNNYEGIDEVLNAMNALRTIHIAAASNGSPILQPTEFASFAQQINTVKDIRAYIKTSERSTFPNIEDETVDERK